MVCPVCIAPIIAAGSASGAAFTKNKPLMWSLVILSILLFVYYVYLKLNPKKCNTCFKKNFKKIKLSSKKKISSK